MDTPVGKICIEEKDGAICGLHIERGAEGGHDLDAGCGADSGCAGSGTDSISGDSDLLRRAKRELMEYFEGSRTEFDLPLCPEGTVFQKKVWDALRRIPYGETRSYGEIACAVGNPKASRAVGGANNKNPIMILIPCHRVIGKDGSLVGFGGGLDVKEKLLKLESMRAGRA